jgi:2-amino-4-hydroxy-6-hydroxymethyldihydropteridine diphosphokinase
VTSELHPAYLILGSNIGPEVHLPKAVTKLSAYGVIQKISSAWENEPVGTTGPNFLNACVLFESNFQQDDLKHKVISRIEDQLGRQRTSDKYAPRTIDIDIVIFDGSLLNYDLLDLAFVVVPLAEIHPGFQNPVTGEPLQETATRLRRDVWLEARPGVLA